MLLTFRRFALTILCAFLASWWPISTKAWNNSTKWSIRKCMNLQSGKEWTTTTSRIRLNSKTSPPSTTAKEKASTVCCCQSDTMKVLLLPKMHQTNKSGIYDHITCKPWQKILSPKRIMWSTLNIKANSINCHSKKGLMSMSLKKTWNARKNW